MDVMKKIIVAAVALLMAVACGEDNKEKVLNVVGDWNITGISTKAAQIGGVQVDIWLALKSDKTFALYQKVGSGRYASYEGTYALAGTVLTGKYSDGKSWGTEYEVTMEDNDTVLILAGASGETDTFRKGAIPSDVLNNLE